MPIYQASTWFFPGAQSSQSPVECQLQADPELVQGDIQINLEIDQIFCLALNPEGWALALSLF